jgi:hypothetical protein
MNRAFVWTLVLALLFVVAVYAVSWWLLCPSPTYGLSCARVDHLTTFYAESLRGSLFTGFLTLGGFLLSLKAFIVVNMKKEVYDTAAYKDLWSDSRSRGETVGALYSPLRDLSESLYIAILACVLTSASQFTIGLLEFIPAVLFCLWSALCAIVLLLLCLLKIRFNLRSMFSHLDKMAEDQAPTKNPNEVR